MGTGAPYTRLDQFAVPTADIPMNSRKLTGLTDPTANQDSATMSYVLGQTRALNAKPSVKAATTANITRSTPQTIDGIALIAGDRCLVKNQTNPQENGIYTVASGVWQRVPDMDIWTEIPSAFTFVEEGTVNKDTGWLSLADQGGTLNTTAINWKPFTGPFYGTTPPANPADGTEWIYPVGSGTLWRFRYNASGGSFKWEFMGGSAAYVVVDAEEGTSSLGPLDLTTVGPSFTVPRAGTYRIELVVHVNGSVSATAMYVSYKVGAAAALVFIQGGGAAANAYLGFSGMVEVVAAASDVLKIQYGASGGTGKFVFRRMKITPVMVL
jgi:hypothetical protein